MARPLRIEFPGALYHLTSRGNARQPIFLDDEDRRAFLERLGEVVDSHHWDCHCYCLMTNHFHLLVETPEPNLSRGMRRLNGQYSQRFNRRHDRVGHILQGRFTGILVEREAHLLELARYVVLNPVRAGMVASAEDYPWSSLRATLGLAPVPSWLRLEGLLARFGSRSRYREFVREGLGARSPWTGLRGALLGSDEFVERLTGRLDRKASESEFPRRQRLAHREPLDALLSPRPPAIAPPGTSASGSWCGPADTRRPRSAATSGCTTRRSARSRRGGTTEPPRRTATRLRPIQDSRSDPLKYPAAVRCPVCGDEREQAGPECAACGADRTSLAPGAVVAERYEIRSYLGRGGMGSVYRAFDRVLDEEVALKVQRAQSASGPEAERRFRSEVKLARQVSHPNVCRLHDGGQEGALRWISMELVPGETLAARLQGGALPVEEVLRLGAQAADGLAAVHRAGIVHRDLKTLNLMVDATGRLRLMDFGIAKPATGGETGAGGYALGQPRVHEPRAGARPPLRRAERRLLAGRRPVRARDRPRALPRRDARCDAPAAPPGPAPARGGARVAAADPGPRARQGAGPAIRRRRRDGRGAARGAGGPRPGAASAAGALAPPGDRAGAGAGGSDCRAVLPDGRAARAAPPRWPPRRALSRGRPRRRRRKRQAPAVAPSPRVSPSPVATRPVAAEAAPTPSPEPTPTPPLPTPEPAIAAPPAAAPPTPSPTPVADGALLVVARPWADVSVDGVPRGQTPLARIALPAGSHAVLLTHPDYQPYPRRVTIRPGETLRLTVDLATDGVRRR